MSDRGWVEDPRLEFRPDESTAASAPAGRAAGIPPGKLAAVRQRLSFVTHNLSHWIPKRANRGVAVTAWRVDLFVEGDDDSTPVEIDDKYPVERVKQDLVRELRLEGDEFELQLVDAFALADGVKVRLVKRIQSSIKILKEREN